MAASRASSRRAICSRWTRSVVRVNRTRQPTDFIRTATRNQLERHADTVKQVVARKMMELGLRDFSRADLEAVRTAGQMLDIRVLGLARIANDVTPELARATIGSIAVLGALHARSAVKAALADRIR